MRFAILLKPTLSEIRLSFLLVKRNQLTLSKLSHLEGQSRLSAAQCVLRINGTERIKKIVIAWDFWCSLKCISTWWACLPAVLALSFFLTIHGWTYPAYVKRSWAFRLLIRARSFLIVLCSVMFIALFVVKEPWKILLNTCNQHLFSWSKVPTQSSPPLRNSPFFSPFHLK